MHFLPLMLPTHGWCITDNAMSATPLLVIETTLVLTVGGRSFFNPTFMILNKYHVEELI